MSSNVGWIRLWCDTAHRGYKVPYNLQRRGDVLKCMVCYTLFETLLIITYSYILIRNARSSMNSVNSCLLERVSCKCVEKGENTDQ